MVIDSKVISEDKTLIFLQVRSDSHRLPGKWRLPLAHGQSAVEILLTRISSIGALGRVVVLTTKRSVDDNVDKKLSSEFGVDVFRGEVDDVGARFVDAITEYGPDHVIRLTGDNPFVPTDLLEMGLKGKFARNDYVSTKIGQGYPPGTDIEIFDSRAYLRLRLGELSNFDREHVTPIFYSGPESVVCKKMALSRPIDELSVTRLTLDTRDDLSRLRAALIDMTPEELNGPWELVAQRLSSLFPTVL